LRRHLLKLYSARRWPVKAAKKFADETAVHCRSYERNNLSLQQAPKMVWTRFLSDVEA
jgi:hypothetical protein